MPTIEELHKAIMEKESELEDFNQQIVSLRAKERDF